MARPKTFPTEAIAKRSWYLANKDKVKASAKKYYHNHRDQVLNDVHQRMYGEPRENKQKRLEAQGFRCANPGCRTTDPGPQGWHTDHDHETGKVRGELCGRCNLALGLLLDDEFRAEGLAEYIRRFKCQATLSTS